MYRASPMYLIHEINGTSSPIRYGTTSFLCRLEIPDDGVESRMFNYLVSSERHVSSSEGG